MAQWQFCWYCGTKLIFTKRDHPRQRTVDHVVPESAGGDKFVDSCKRCNNLKSNSSVDEYRTWLGIEQFYGEGKGWLPW